MSELDIPTRALLQVEPRALVQLAEGGARVRTCVPEESALVRLERRMDKLFRVRLEGERRPRWRHVEVAAAWRHDLPDRVFTYWSWARLVHRPLRSVLIVLRPDARRGTPTDRLAVEDPDSGRRQLDFRFELVCVWRLRARELIARDEPGLLPLLPFADGATAALVERALARLGPVHGPGKRLELATTLLALAGSVFPNVPWLAMIPRETAMKSTVIQQLLAEGKREGKREGALEGRRELLALQLRTRLGRRAPPLLARVEVADRRALDEAAKLVARPGPVGALAEALDAVLPPAEG